MGADQVIEVSSSGEVLSVDDYPVDNHTTDKLVSDYSVQFIQELDDELRLLDSVDAKKRLELCETSAKLGRRLSAKVNTMAGRAGVQRIENTLKIVVDEVGKKKDPQRRLRDLMAGAEMDESEKYFYFKRRIEKDTVEDSNDLFTSVNNLHAETKWIAASRKYQDALEKSKSSDDIPRRPFLSHLDEKEFNGEVSISTLNKAFYVGWQQVRVEGMRELKTVTLG